MYFFHCVMVVHNQSLICWLNMVSEVLRASDSCFCYVMKLFRMVFGILVTPVGCILSRWQLLHFVCNITCMMVFTHCLSLVHSIDFGLAWRGVFIIKQFIKMASAHFEAVLSCVWHMWHNWQSWFLPNHLLVFMGTQVKISCSFDSLHSTITCFVFSIVDHQII